MDHSPQQPLHNTTESMPNEPSWAKIKTFGGNTVGRQSLFVITWILLCSTTAASIVHYMRVPKTGSTSAMEIIRSLKNESSCFGENIKVHNHVDGCQKLNVCNGSHIPPLDASIAVLREPCERFLSVVAHMQSRNNPKHPLNNAARFRSLESVFNFLEASNCKGNPDPKCLVDFINLDKSLGGHRVILYPQSFFINSATTDVVCSKEKAAGVMEAVRSTLVRSSGCISPINRYSENATSSWKNSGEHPLNMTSSQCDKVLGLFVPDAHMWKRRCTYVRRYVREPPDVSFHV